MTIKVTATRNDNNSLHLLRIEVTEESIRNFLTLVDRALNCWDNAPQELKELGDKLTHDRVTQDHSPKPMFTGHNHDYYTADEQTIIQRFIEVNGVSAWLEHLSAGTQHKVLKGTASSPSK